MIKSLKDLEDFLCQEEYINTKKFILIDENTYNNCLGEIIQEVDSLNGAEILEIESSEKMKHLGLINDLALSMIESKADCSSVLICLGGGVVSDIGGFLASVFKRGIRHILVPTTLLSIIDASIGGKTGVNISNYKNQIGSFYNPVFTAIHIPFLETLSPRHILNGMAEILKIALISDNGLWEKLKENPPINYSSFDRDIIYSSIRLKQEIVEKDPMEDNYRKVLNLGHSLGHAFESLLLEKNHDILHGEAIASGLYYMIKLSHDICSFPKEKVKDILSFIEKYYSIISLEDNIIPVIDYLYADKKNLGGVFQFVLLKDIGQPIISCQITEKDLYGIFQK